MKIAILSRQPRCYSVQRLKEEGRKRNHSIVTLDTMRFSIEVEQGAPDLYYKNKSIPNYDAILPRIGPSVTFFGLAVLRQFEQMDVYVANSAIAVQRSRDKLRSMQILSRYDIGIPHTAFVRDKKDVLPAIERVGGAPVIIKLLEGTQGLGVILADTVKVAKAIIETLQSTKQNVLIQKFVKESKGKDIRAVVVGDRVVAAMRRKATGEEFRSNVHLGASTEKVDLTAEYEHTAIRAAQILGLRIAGVDMLESAEGPQVMEVNSSPGLRGIETATGVNVAGAMIEDIEDQVLFPDVDLKQRLRLTGGYGIAEFPVHHMPVLEGKALRETDLDARNVHVMSVTRKSAVVANPNGDEVIRKGDLLLCYGELSELRSLMPEKKRRRRKTKKK